jgi:hypothetical protein
MSVLGELTWHVVVDDCLDSFDIETSGCEIGSEQVINLTTFEVVQRIQSLPVSLASCVQKRGDDLPVPG